MSLAGYCCLLYTTAVCGIGIVNWRGCWMTGGLSGVIGRGRHRVGTLLGGLVWVVAEAFIGKEAGRLGDNSGSWRQVCC